MNKKTYITPSLKVVKLEENVITTSTYENNVAKYHNIVDDAEEL